MFNIKGKTRSKINNPFQCFVLYGSVVWYSESVFMAVFVHVLYLAFTNKASFQLWRLNLNYTITVKQSADAMLKSGPSLKIKLMVVKL